MMRSTFSPLPHHLSAPRLLLAAALLTCAFGWPRTAVANDAAADAAKPTAPMRKAPIGQGGTVTTPHSDAGMASRPPDMSHQPPAVKPPKNVDPRIAEVPAPARPVPPRTREDGRVGTDSKAK